MAYSPAAMQAVYDHVYKVLPSMERSGIYANKSGYHNSRNNHRQSRPNDYSIQTALDKEGDGDAASAIDMKFNTRDMGIVCRRLMAASTTKDPRLQGKVREWFGSFDGRNLTGYSLYRGRIATSDSSHLWHVHISGWRKYANDKKVWLGVTEVVLGLSAGTLTGTAPKPAPTVYKPDPDNLGVVFLSKLHPGVKDSDSVWQYQVALKNIGLYTQVPTAEYGSKTTAAVKAFQLADPDLKVDADGDTGPLTARKVFVAAGNAVRIEN